MVEIRGNCLISGKSTLVKYYNLARFVEGFLRHFWWSSKSFASLFLKKKRQILIQNSSNWILFTKLRQKVCGKNGSQFDDSAYASTVFKPHGFVDKRRERSRTFAGSFKEKPGRNIPQWASLKSTAKLGRSPRFTRWIIGAKTSMRWCPRCKGCQSKSLRWWWFSKIVYVQV